MACYWKKLWVASQHVLLKIKNIRYLMTAFEWGFFLSSFSSPWGCHFIVFAFYLIIKKTRSSVQYYWSSHLSDENLSLHFHLRMFLALLSSKLCFLYAMTFFVLWILKKRCFPHVMTMKVLWLFEEDYKIFFHFAM